MKNNTTIIELYTMTNLQHIYITQPLNSTAQYFTQEGAKIIEIKTKNSMNVSIYIYKLTRQVTMVTYYAVCFIIFQIREFRTVPLNRNTNVASQQGHFQLKINKNLPQCRKYGHIYTNSSFSIKQETQMHGTA